MKNIENLKFWGEEGRGVPFVQAFFVSVQSSEELHYFRSEFILTDFDPHKNTDETSFLLKLDEPDSKIDEVSSRRIYLAQTCYEKSQSIFMEGRRVGLEYYLEERVVLGLYCSSGSAFVSVGVNNEQCKLIKGLLQIS